MGEYRRLTASTLAIAMEYYLLCYGQNTGEGSGENMLDLTYCVKLGNLSETIVECFAIEHQIAYGDQSEVKGYFDSRFEGSLLMIRPDSSFDDALWSLCAKAMVRFEEESKSDVPNEVVQFIKHFVQIVAKYQEGLPSTTAESIPHIADYAHFPHQIQAASGRGVPPIIEAYEDSIEEATEPARVIIDGISPAALKAVAQAHYEAELTLVHRDKVDEWHIISKTRYKGKGWADIARKELEQQKKDGKIKSFTKDTVESLARNIQNQVETHRKNLGIMADKNGEQ